MVKKLATVGDNALSPKDWLIYWLWWSDYMMRNAGDFANAALLKKDFQHAVTTLAHALGLPYTAETFSLPRAELQRQYFGRFERVCDEIRGFAGE